MNLGELVRARRTEAGMTRMKLAMMMHEYGIKTNESWVVKVENGDVRQPSPKSLLALAAILQLPLDLILRATGPDGVPDTSLSTLDEPNRVSGVRDALAEDAYKLAHRLTALPKLERIRVLRQIERIMPDAKVSLTG